MTNKIVEITITDGHNYVESVKDGMAFTSVGYNASLYGASSPCDNGEEISYAIESAKECIINAGDKPKVVDKRESATLSKWL